MVMMITRQAKEDKWVREKPMKTVYDMKELGRAVRERRRELGYTQAFLADYAGISASFLSELENGKATIQAGKMMEVIGLLGMDICVRNRGE